MGKQIQALVFIMRDLRGERREEVGKVVKAHTLEEYIKVSVHQQHPFLSLSASEPCKKVHYYFSQIKALLYRTKNTLMQEGLQAVKLPHFESSGIR